LSVDEGVRRRVVKEMYLWFVTASIACGVASSMASYALRELTASRGLVWSAVYSVMLVLSVLWFVASLTLLVNSLRILLRRGAPWRRLRGEELTELVVDAVALYRGYRHIIIAVSAACIAVGSAMAVLSVLSFAAGSMRLSELGFRAFVSGIMAVYGALSLALARRSMCRRLAALSSFETELRRFIEGVRDEA